MRSFAILGDSTCDLNKDLRTQLDVDYVQMNFVLDGKEVKLSNFSIFQGLNQVDLLFS